MTGCRLVESRGNNLPFDTTLHISDFFGTFIDQQNDQIALWVVLFDRIGDILQQNGFTSPWRRHDQTTLAFTNGRHQIDDTCRAVLDRRIIHLHRETFVGVEWRKVFKCNLVPCFFGRLKVDFGHFSQCKVTFGIIRRLDQTFDRVPRAQRMLADHLGRNINIIRARQVVCLGRAQEPEAVLQYFQHTIARDFPPFIRAFAQDLEHHLAFTHRRCVFDLKLFGHRQKILRRLRL